MKNTIFVVDDDTSIVNILNNIIDENFPGEFIGMATTGSAAIKKISLLRPDIILLDYLLPDKDGLDVIKEIQILYSPIIIMISEVSDKNMIAKAYNHDIEFFINKPINVVEVMTIINKAKRNFVMKNIIANLKNTFTNIDYLSSLEYSHATSDLQLKLKRFYNKLGIIGESGCDDLINATIWVDNLKGKKYKLSDMYRSLVNDPKDKSQLYAVEQRIRRTISKAFNIMASLGIEDYMNPVFENYGSRLFDFNELRKQMNYLKGRSLNQGKINIRKFIESSIILIHDPIK
ncbi:response regulator [Paramaledivibacter caminithermalis]|jgi:two-component system response regulator YcbB|uniref:Stage 0 sporulation protein A homolog n=1 Tax=Paramaledivibacter caminithermalis (strain DSM 15212 / CIP 107654 / DViRD3) TaxID=1121301 RepID=A0A1M6QIZ9_PARC5|nr:response regulator [Paramaledivibacter caminithermalis]SHK20176.1 two-component system, response regulator YcbB [Paramaledivibacter caminithermalis DSM 15212]